MNEEETHLMIQATAVVACAIDILVPANGFEPLTPRV